MAIQQVDGCAFTNSAEGKHQPVVTSLSRRQDLIEPGPSGNFLRNLGLEPVINWSTVPQRVQVCWIHAFQRRAPLTLPKHKPSHPWGVFPPEPPAAAEPSSAVAFSYPTSERADGIEPRSRKTCLHCSIILGVTSRVPYKQLPPLKGRHLFACGEGLQAVAARFILPSQLPLQYISPLWAECSQKKKAEFSSGVLTWPIVFCGRYFFFFHWFWWGSLWKNSIKSIVRRTLWPKSVLSTF